MTDNRYEPPQKLVESLNESLLEFFDKFTSWESSVIQSGPLKISDVHAIEILGHYGEMNMKELAQRLGVTTGTTTVTVDRLERGDFAYRKRAASDRRSYIIELTDAGHAAYLEHHRHHLHLAHDLISKLGEEEAESLLHLLRKANEYF
ncbi:MAG: MarR family transcriptional regulator [Methanomicrobiales archaeon]|jgi:DNA-binding MarR family transcriptional regulator|nr:MarR family transcriptional regulator [Methanomicrobiales archaeon]